MRLSHIQFLLQTHLGTFQVLQHATQHILGVLVPRHNAFHGNGFVMVIVSVVMPVMSPLNYAMQVENVEAISIHRLD